MVVQVRIYTLSVKYIHNITKPSRKVVPVGALQLLFMCTSYFLFMPTMQSHNWRRMYIRLTHMPNSNAAKKIHTYMPNSNVWYRMQLLFMPTSYFSCPYYIGLTIRHVCYLQYLGTNWNVVSVIITVCIESDVLLVKLILLKVIRLIGVLIYSKYVTMKK